MVAPCEVCLCSMLHLLSLKMREPNDSILYFLPNILTPTTCSLYPYYTVTYQTSPGLCLFTREKVEKVLATLNSDSEIGPDGISSRVIKTCYACLAHPHSAISMLSFALGYPTWKLTNITAFNPLNYRLISLFLIISKVMESIIAVDMKSFFSNKLISDYQFGFRQGHSIHFGHSASTHRTMYGSPQCQT